MEENIELIKTDLERQRIEGELRLKEEELALKRQELLLKQEEIKPKNTVYFSPLVLTALTALVGFIGTCVGFLLQGSINANLERQKMESSLILKAIEPGKPDEAAKILRFLLNAGLIQDKEGRIARLEDDSKKKAISRLKEARRASKLALQGDMTMFDIQEILEQRGFYSGEITGMYDELTIEAIRRFQMENHLEPDGLPGFRTISSLRELTSPPGTIEPDGTSSKAGENALENKAP